MTSNNKSFEIFQSNNNLIIQFLRDNPGKKYSASQISEKFKINLSQVRQSLSDLAFKKIIKITYGNTTRYFYEVGSQTSVGVHRSTQMNSNPWMPPKSMTDRLNPERKTAISMSSKITEFQRLDDK